jgi:Flp pilus assembly protein TadG
VRPPRPSWLQRFIRANRGAAAVEFALISLPLMMLIFGSIELGLVLLASTTLEGATESAGRLIRTGQFQQGSSTSQTNFQSLVCQRMGWLAANCASDVWVDVRTFATFHSLSVVPPPPPPPPPTPGDPNPKPPTCFVVGGPDSIVLVRVYLRWKLFTPMLDGAMENLGAGSGLRLISSATAFRNEPYDNTLTTPPPAACPT